MKETNSKKKPEKSSKKKLIDIMQKAFEDAGYKVERDGWSDPIPGEKATQKDWAEWLDIVGPLDPKDGRQTSVHFYFTDDATKLSEVTVYRDNWRATDTESSDACWRLKQEN